MTFEERTQTRDDPHAPTGQDQAQTPRFLIPPESGRLSLLRAELAFEHAVARHRELAMFRRNVATWELLLLLAGARGATVHGVHGLVDAVSTRGLGPSALLRFVRDRRDDGQLIVTPDPGKRSRQRVTLRPDLIEALLAELEVRRRAAGRLAFPNLSGQGAID